MKTKVLAILLSVVALTSTFCVSASAVTATLQENETYKCTSTISATKTKAQIYNAASSAHEVYGYIEYKSGDKFVTDFSFLVAKGKGSGWKNSASEFLTNKSWHLEINPYGALWTGCTADGEIVSR